MKFFWGYKQKLAGIICFIIFPVFLFAQNNDTIPKELNRKRLCWVGSGLAFGYGSSLYLLNDAWYSDYPHSRFHFFNDNREWQQVDKVGHFFTANLITQYSIDLFKWTGLNSRQSAWYGGGVSFLYMSTIEILDGFSQQWGASPGDLMANSLGAGIAIAQELGFKNQEVLVKWSFHPTSFSTYRPNLLGSNMPEQMLKDYNGQTYWLSFNLKNHLGLSFCPKWLNIAFGYGAEGMIGGDNNPQIYNEKVMPNFDRYRQYYLSFDIDLRKIKTNNVFLKKSLRYINVIKIPSPALELSRGKIKTHYFYF